MDEKECKQDDKFVPVMMVIMHILSFAGFISIFVPSGGFESDFVNYLVYCIGGVFYIVDLCFFTGVYNTLNELDNELNKAKAEIQRLSNLQK